MIENVITELVYFLLVGFAFGSLMRKVKFEDLAEEFIIKFLFGVCIFPIIAIPFAAASQLTPINIGGFALLCIVFSDLSEWRIVTILKSRAIFIIAVLFLVLFADFYIGASSSVWVEDGDPNGFAVAASYIAHYATYAKPTDLYVVRYIEPYPVGYQVWMGLLSAINGNVNNVLKVFNSLFIALTLFAFYYFVMRLYDDRKIAILSTFVLFALPCFSTRFIFAQSLAMLQLILAFYFIARMVKGEHELFIWAGIILGALCLTHQTTGIVMGAMIGLWFVVDCLYNRRFNRIFVVALVVALVVAVPWWVSQFERYGWDKIKYQLNLGRLGETAFGLTDPNLRFYSLGDLVNVPLNNGIDNMTGFGVIVFVCALIWLVSWGYEGIISRFKNIKYGDYVILSWFVFTILAVFSNSLPISFIPSRMWVYLSIPLAVISGSVLAGMYEVKYEAVRAMFYLAIIGVLLTSFAPKALFNAGTWGNSRLESDDEYKMAGFLAGLPIGTKVMDACYYERVWAYNLWDDPLDTNMLALKNKDVNKTYGWDDEGWLKMKDRWSSPILSGDPDGITKSLKDNRYEYLILGSKCMKIANMDSNVLGDRVQNLKNSGFDVAFHSGDEYVLKVK